MRRRCRRNPQGKPHSHEGTWVGALPVRAEARRARCGGAIRPQGYSCAGPGRSSGSPNFVSRATAPGLVAEQLERVERGEIDRLMLCMPPRHGKSELASKSFPAHCIGLDPTEMFISASAGMELGAEISVDCPVVEVPVG